MRALYIYSRDWRDERIYSLYRAFTVLLQKHRAYALERILEKRPSRALVFTYPCGWHGDVLFLAPYVVAVGPFDRGALVDFVMSLPDRVALTLLEGGWTVEEVFKEFGPFDVGVACMGAPVAGVRRYVHKMIVVKIGGPLGELISALYAPEEEDADEAVMPPL
ncbi:MULTISPECIES: hypothetical protein [Pyrobaculum]|uniref:Uncharacterized protein n=1 Tax=Pyrobaculum arsenaticum TaxID=121277 RepID=A0A7L4P6Z8_9CREN|nr:hypothetical protein [Pyrobaculum arsenaticum]MCY0890438.1 hypothetical protein [Pyrobaculum arsenaticum]NYR14612.1 hypothetical protein [Pyrobaculum arsenaticum]